MIVAVAVGHELSRALSFAFGMTWEVLWALILGFALSGAVQAVVSKRVPYMVRGTMRFKRQPVALVDIVQGVTRATS